MTIIEKIKAEIERQMKFYDEKETKAWDDSEQGDEDALWYQGHRKMCAKLLSFLGTLDKSEKSCEGLEEEIEKEYTKLPPVLDLAKFEDYTIIKAFASHFYELGCRRTAEKYETI